MYIILCVHKNLKFLNIIITSMYRIVQNGGREIFGEFGKSKAIRQSFTHPNLHLKTANSRLPKIHREKMHAMSILKYFCPLREKPGYPVLFYKKVLFHQWEHSKHFYIRGIPLPHLILQTCIPFLWYM